MKPILISIFTSVITVITSSVHFALLHQERQETFFTDEMYCKYSFPALILANTMLLIVYFEQQRSQIDGTSDAQINVLRPSSLSASKAVSTCIFRSFLTQSLI